MQVKCSQCEKTYKVDESAIGKKVKCKCGHSFIVPKAEAQSADQKSAVPPLPGSSSPTSPSDLPAVTSAPDGPNTGPPNNGPSAPFEINTDKNTSASPAGAPAVSTGQSSVLQSRKKQLIPAWMIWSSIGGLAAIIVVVVILMGPGAKDTPEDKKVAQKQNQSKSKNESKSSGTNKKTNSPKTTEKKEGSNGQNEKQNNPNTVTPKKNDSQGKKDKKGDPGNSTTQLPVFAPDMTVQIELPDWNLPTDKEAAEMVLGFSTSTSKEKAEFEEMILRANGAAVPVLIEKVIESDQNRNSKYATFGLCQLLSKIGAPALDPLLKLAKDSSLDDETRAHVLRAIGDMGPIAKPAIDDIAKLYDESKPGLRGLILSSAGALAGIGVINERVRKIFSEILVNEGKKFQTNFLSVVLKGAKEIGPDAAPLVPEIRTYLLTGSYQAQDAAEALGAIGAGAGSAAEEFKQLIEGEDKVVSFRKFHALRDIGESAKAVTPSLVQALKDTDDDFERANIADALGRMGPAAIDALPTLNEYLKEAEATEFDQAQRIAFKLAIARIQGDQRAAIPYLRSALTDNKHNARTAAAEQIGRLGPDGRELVPDLVSIIQNIPSKQGVVRLAIQSLGNLGKEGADGLGAVIDFINRQHVDPKGQKTYRLHAIDTIAKINSDKRVVEGLTRIAHHDPNPKAREKAVRWLQKLSAQ